MSRGLPEQRVARRHSGRSAAVIVGGGLALGALALGCRDASDLPVALPDSATGRQGSLLLPNGLVLALPNGWAASEALTQDGTWARCLGNPQDAGPESECAVEVRVPLPGEVLTEAVAPVQVSVETCDERADPRLVQVEHFSVPAGPALHATGRCSEAEPIVSVWALEDRALVIRVTDQQWDRVGEELLGSATGASTSTRPSSHSDAP